MKKLAFIFCFVFAFAINANAQFVYQDGYLTFNRDRYPNYTTSWAGWAHFWGSSNTNGIKMHIHAADPRMSTTTNKLVFLDSDRSMYIDLYCRTMYQSSDESLKTNIQPLLPAFSLLNSSAASSIATNIVMKLKPVTFHWKDESEYERFNIRPVKAGVVENGFIAQELEQVVPGAVAMTAEGDRLVNYSALIPILTGAIQELNARIASLEAKLAQKN